jgi:ribonuclease VapC
LIVVDTSAVIAILQEEPDSATLMQALANTSRPVIGAPTKFELLMVASRPPGREDDARQFLDAIGCEVADWTNELADIATEAFLCYGKGRGHAAKLNFGDCMSYALAKSLDAPLLFKGDDFTKTDIRSALP